MTEREREREGGGGGEEGSVDEFISRTNKPLITVDLFPSRSSGPLTSCPLHDHCLMHTHVPDCRNVKCTHFNSDAANGANLSVISVSLERSQPHQLGYFSGRTGLFVELFVGWLASQQHASVSQGRICSDNLTCCHTEIEVADQTFYLTHSQYTDTGPTSPSADPITPGAWQGCHWIANF